jgi:prevent-host-death family protein
MAELTLTNARAHLADVVDEARTTHEPVYLSRRGKRVAAVIGIDDLARLTELAEDAEDIRAAAASRADQGPNISLEELRAELGL